MKERPRSGSARGGQVTERLSRDLSGSVPSSVILRLPCQHDGHVILEGTAREAHGIEQC